MLGLKNIFISNLAIDSWSFLNSFSSSLVIFGSEIEICIRSFRSIISLPIRSKLVISAEIEEIFFEKINRRFAQIEKVEFDELSAAELSLLEEN